MDRIRETRIPSPEAGVKLKVFVAAPSGPGPHPTIVFHHGSTGRGHPAMYGRRWCPAVLQQWFTERGWMVLFPQRRGRGGSEGRYAEGLRNEGGGFSCERPTAGIHAGHELGTRGFPPSPE